MQPICGVARVSRVIGRFIKADFNNRAKSEVGAEVAIRECARLRCKLALMCLTREMLVQIQPEASR